MTTAVIIELEHHTPSAASLECLAEARDLAQATGGRVVALLPVAEAQGQAGLLVAHGADEVISVAHQSLAAFSADRWLAVFEPLLRTMAPSLILAPDSGAARAWLPRLAWRCAAPIITRCLAIWPGADGVLEFTRPAHSGAQHERLACPGAATIVATLAPGARGPGQPNSARQGLHMQITAELSTDEGRDQVLRFLPPDPRTVDISEAERVIAGGLGVGSPAGLDLLWQLADQLGAALGGTRVIADRGWLPFERQIGTTGKSIAPQLYLAIGISGASQHTSGITSSDTVIVINTDRSAPMFGFADLGLVGDMHQLVPELLRLLAADKDTTSKGARVATP